ncbi:hypothetical protein Q7C_2040 [Methylophaga frappieri]|uniref:Uncharacterized protein n=1 Tax=Methylophaga frappieri (strain ATCC BAA-2434 / DSM 25690 / JAM7) TaxID=754477 RepID=I1YJT6_METFJ|nr:hypothetical protein [Methylophaga frappieri]AFJ03179.1 hypothetical protein Q7C_2040 [Methylophaga frappieri]
MSALSQMFASVAVLAEFHPGAQAVRFWRNNHTGQLQSDIVFSDQKLTDKQLLEADIASIATQLAEVALPDYFAFCRDIEAIFSGSQPNGPVTKLANMDWPALRQIAIYAQHWRSKNPREVAKLVAFVMAIPVFSRLVGQRIVAGQSETEKQISHQVEHASGMYIMGVEKFKGLFADEIQSTLSEASLLVAAYRGAKGENASNIINGMIASRYD